MDELSKKISKLSIEAARSKRFLSQPFFVMQETTGQEGRYVSLKQTLKGFQEIVAGAVDYIPEHCFYMKGSIDDVYKAYKDQK